MKNLPLILIISSIMAACLLGTMLSLPLQSPALILIGLGGVFASWRGRHVRCHLPTLVPVLVAGVYFSCRSLTSPVQDLAVEDLFLILASGGFYLVAGPLAGTPRMRLFMAIAFLLVLCLHLGSAVIQIIGEKGYSLVRLFTADAAKPWEPTADLGIPISGMYGYIGSFANFGMMTGVLALCLGLWGRLAGWLRVALCLLGLLALVAASLAQSRSAMLSLVVGAPLLLLMLWMSVAGQSIQLRKRLRTGIVGVGCAGMILGILGAGWVFMNRAPETEAGGLSFGSDVRLGYWPMAVEQFVDHPIIGAGSRSFSYECFQYWNPTLESYEANPEFVHNEYLQVLADYGMVGFLLLLAVVGTHLWMGMRAVHQLSGRLAAGSLREGANVMALAIAGVVGMVVMMVHIVFDFRTHLLSNLLLFVGCAVWVLPVVKRGTQEQTPCGLGKFSSWALSSFLFVFSMASIILGVQHLHGGIPLLKNKMGREAGLWNPQSVSREVWIPALEDSVSRVPTYRRHLKLGTLYSMNAAELKGDAREQMVSMAIKQYEHAAQRHPFEPVSQLNLAQLHGSLQQYEKADALFRKADQLGSSREFWFKIHLKWGEMLRLRAGTLWHAGKLQEAQIQYQRSLGLLEPLDLSRGENGHAYTRVVIEYVRLLDKLEQYPAANDLILSAEENLPNGVIFSLEHHFIRELAEHYLREAKYHWLKRNPENAWKSLLVSREKYQIHQGLLKGKQDDRADQGLKGVVSMIEFFRKTGISGNE